MRSAEQLAHPLTVGTAMQSLACIHIDRITNLATATSCNMLWCMHFARTEMQLQLCLQYLVSPTDSTLPAGSSYAVTIKLVPHKPPTSSRQLALSDDDSADLDTQIGS